MFKNSSSYQLRKLNLLNTLANADDYVDIKELASELNANKRAIDSTIETLSKTDVRKICTIEENNNKYRLQFNPSYTVDSIGHYMLTHSTRSIVLEHVFFNNNLTLEELCEATHFSTATLYRIIHRLNDGIKKHYDLEFVTNPCRLVGKEDEIRSFYMQYFSEKYPYSEWPFTDIDRERLLDLFKLFTDSLGFKLQYSDLRFLELCLAVSHIRCNQGFCLEEPGPRLSGILSYLNNNEEFMNMFLGIFKDNANREVFNDNLIYIIREHFYFNYEELSISAETDPYSKKSFKYLNDMVNMLSVKYNVPVINQDELIYNTHNSAQLGFRNLNVRTILMSNKDKLLSEFKSLFKNFYNDVETGITEYVELMELERKEPLVNHLMHSFLTRWENLYKTLYDNQRKIKIHIASSHDIFHAKFMLRMIQTEFHQQVECSLIHSFDLGNLARDKENTDILVTNFTYDDAYVVAVNDIPTKDDFNTINHMIKKIRSVDD